MSSFHSIARVRAGLALTASIGAAALSASPAAAAQTVTAPGPTVPGGSELGVGTYAQRQAIRDQYRGQIDDLTFNDELGDGVPVSQALADAMAARSRGS